MALQSEEKNMFRSNVALPEGHEKRFLDKLEKELPEKQKKRSVFFYVKIAAAAIIVIGIGSMLFIHSISDTKEELVPDNQVVDTTEETESSPENEQITLGDLSPDLKKVEEYYVASINVTLASLEINDVNKRLFEGYMDRLSVLNKEYKTLTTELNTYGPNEQTIGALINNLQLRLQLLYKLKNKLDEFKKTKQDESKG
ncbi:hypothetical protein NBRC110019_10530 [Neptunitalea chrysea]|uniref:Anti-sigma factor n=1 Tax=Neptunitalea chrysea TaxID=1647581 RepID=A0A9W6B3U5_9FLAO|nr:hypothetical protein [Neptunitalea chrysea]GLB52014.1 hypothetical protein NBRC110019_10530 [Neptunitalea chrysea]